MLDMATTSDNTLLSPTDVERSHAILTQIETTLNQAIVGQSDVIRQVLTCLLAQGHVLLEGLPGLGKTELVKSLSRLLGLPFRRVQFTPDLLPSDILGVSILEDREEGRKLVFHPGPVFTNLLLADEINRTTPKTQAALLEAMQERTVTILGESRPLPRPFFVLATQNPIELEGTYPLPEAQLDRFLAKILVGQVSSESLERIIAARSTGREPQLAKIVDATDFVALLDQVTRVHLPKAVGNYIARLVSASHPQNDSAPNQVKTFVRHGASPRAALALATMARASALLSGKPNAGFDEVKRVAIPVLRHRIIADYSARLDGITTDEIIIDLLETVPELDRQLPPDLQYS